MQVQPDDAAQISDDEYEVLVELEETDDSDDEEELAPIPVEPLYGVDTDSRGPKHIVVMDVTANVPHKPSYDRSMALNIALMLPLTALCVIGCLIAYRRRRAMLLAAQRNSDNVTTTSNDSMRVVFTDAKPPSSPYPYNALNQPQFV